MRRSQTEPDGSFKVQLGREIHRVMDIRSFASSQSRPSTPSFQLRPSSRVEAAQEAVERASMQAEEALQQRIAAESLLRAVESGNADVLALLRAEMDEEAATGVGDEEALALLRAEMDEEAAAGVVAVSESAAAAVAGPPAAPRPKETRKRKASPRWVAEV
jgi:hypothetical protein